MAARDNGLDKNPGNRHNGRPKGAKNWSTILRERIEARGLQEKLADAIIDKVLAGDVRAFEAVTDRIEGRPVSTIQTQEIPPIKVEYLPAKEYPVNED